MANLFWVIFILSISVVVGCEVPSHCEAFTIYECLPYVTDDEYLHPPGPGAGCCGDVSAILENSWDCFCYALNEVLLYGMALNKMKGLGLPKACGHSGPKIGGCFADGGYISDTPVAVPPTPTEAPETPTPAISPSQAPLSPSATYQVSSPATEAPAPSPVKETPVVSDHFTDSLLFSKTSHWSLA